MKRYTTQKTISAIKRQSYVGNISSFTTVGTGTCYLRPLSEVESSNNGFQYGVAYSVICETSLDIREMDKITIDSTDYLVKGVVNHNRGSYTPYKRALVVLPQA